MRAALADMVGTLDKKRWEITAALTMVSVWVTDCKSTVEALNRATLAKIKDKRLGIEMASLRQSLWCRTDGVECDAVEADERPLTAEATDVVRWVDTDVMIVDPLTKVMGCTKLVRAIETNRWSLAQPLESLQKKRIKQKQRAKKGSEEADLDGADE